MQNQVHRMKLEFLAEGSADCPLIRLYGFDVPEVMRLREAFRSLCDGSRQEIPLHEEWWVESMEGCQLDLRSGPRDLGVVQRWPMKFDCVLTAEAWLEMVEKTDPFCGSEAPQAGEVYQWLNSDGEISLLLAPTGEW
jgi:hypothetical protein